MDVNEGPLIRAEEHVREAGLKEQIKMRRSNGLEKLSPGEVEAVIIAGMGGGLVMRILTEGQAVAETLQECICSPVGDRKGAGISSAERLSDRAGRDGTG